MDNEKIFWSLSTTSSARWNSHCNKGSTNSQGIVQKRGKENEESANYRALCTHFEKKKHTRRIALVESRQWVVQQCLNSWRNCSNNWTWNSGEKPIETEEGCSAWYFVLHSQVVGRLTIPNKKKSCTVKLKLPYLRISCTGFAVFTRELLSRTLGTREYENQIIVTVEFHTSRVTWMLTSKAELEKDCSCANRLNHSNRYFKKRIDQKD